MNAISSFLDNFFKVRSNGSSVKTEVLAGITTFLTMSYIIMVNPDILANTGMDKGAVFVATCLAASLGCMLMGVIANYPIAIAPGMGLNAYFTYSVCIGMNVPWQVALAAVFVSGLLFVALSLARVREAIINGMPKSLKFAITAGIGLFLALIALKSAGVVVAHPVTFISMGDVRNPGVLLAGLGLLMIIALDHFRVRGAIIISILAITLLSMLLGLSQWNGIVGEVPSLAPTFMQMSFKDLFTVQLVSVIFVFFLVDLFDSTGTMIGVAHRAGLLQDGKLPRLKKALLADSTSIVAGAVMGTSSTTAYVESAAGAAAGGKTGLTAVTVGLLFIAALWFSPLAMSVPAYATAPALLYVGVLMVRGLAEIEWDDITEAAPAFLTAVFMPFAYSIADGIAIGFISYALIKLLCGQGKKVPMMVWVVALLWALKFWYFGG
ncbi:MAG: NCS2 family permease [Neisseria sp.]|nr:NCS2 family permease [Neisseria sp.]